MRHRGGRSGQPRYRSCYRQGDSEQEASRLLLAATAKLTSLFREVEGLGLRIFAKPLDSHKKSQIDAPPEEADREASFALVFQYRHNCQVS